MSTRSIAQLGLPRLFLFLAAVALPLTAASSSASAAQAGQNPGKSGPSSPEPSSKQEWKGDPYLLPTDAATGEPLGPIEKQVKLQHEGREFRFASKANADTFQADPRKYIAAVDEKVVRDQLAFYPLETCLVSGEKLGPGAVNLVYKNRLVRLANKEHEVTFLKDTAKYVAQLDKAVVAKQGPGYAPKTCPVSGEAFGGEMGEPVDYVVGNRLIRMCCKSCKKDLEKDPLKYLLFPDRKNETEPAPLDKGHGHGEHDPH